MKLKKNLISNNSQNEWNIEESIENIDNNKLFQPSEQLE